MLSATARSREQASLAVMPRCLASRSAATGSDCVPKARCVGEVVKLIVKRYGYLIEKSCVANSNQPFGGRILT